LVPLVPLDYLPTERASWPPYWSRPVVAFVTNTTGIVVIQRLMHFL